MSKGNWSMNTFFNNKKIPNIPPLNVNGKIISNFEKKVELLSILPPLEYNTNGWLASANIKEDDIYLILKNLNPQKSHGQKYKLE